MAQALKRILYLTNIPAPYTVDFFNELGIHFELLVIFEQAAAVERDKSWLSFTAANFDYVVLGSGGGRRVSLSILRQLLEREKYDLCIIGDYSSIFGMAAITWLRFHKMPYAIHADGGMISDDFPLKYHIKKSLIAEASILFSSGFSTTDYFQHYGANISRIFEYPFSSVRASQIKSPNDKKKCREKLCMDDRKVLVSVGQMIPRKGFDVLIKAVYLLDAEVDLYIIGGEPTDDIRAQVNECGLKGVHFIPFLPFEEVLDYMCAADIFVLLIREDIWGLVINEALAAGTPIISTNKCVAAVELIENGVNGYIVASENADEASKRISELLENNALCRKMRDNNLKKAASYTIESMTAAYVEIINNYFSYEN